jgi:hypothetical protein
MPKFSRKDLSRGRNGFGQARRDPHMSPTVRQPGRFLSLAPADLLMTSRSTLALLTTFYVEPHPEDRQGQDYDHAGLISVEWLQRTRCLPTRTSTFAGCARS